MSIVKSLGSVSIVKTMPVSSAKRKPRKSTKSRKRNKEINHDVRDQEPPSDDSDTDDEIEHVRNSEDTDDIIHSLLSASDSFLRHHFESDTSFNDGDPRADRMRILKHVKYEMETFFPLQLEVGTSGIIITRQQFSSYCHYTFTEAADYIELNCVFENLENNHGKNDNKRKAASAVISRFPRLVHLLRNIVHLLKEDELFGIRKEVFATSGSGEEDSITLLLALIGCDRQKDHYDYDFEKYLPRDTYDGVADNIKGSYNEFHGASLFINFSLAPQKLDLDYCDEETGEYLTLIIPPMGLLVIRGDLKHAGSANTTGTKIRKFFLYLDRCKGCRMQGEFENGARDNVIYFDSHSRK